MVLRLCLCRMALVEGYESMGRLALAQPQLRARQEEDCKAISSGARTKAQVVRSTTPLSRAVSEETNPKTQLRPPNKVESRAQGEWERSG